MVIRDSIAQDSRAMSTDKDRMAMFGPQPNLFF